MLDYILDILYLYNCATETQQGCLTLKQYSAIRSKFDTSVTSKQNSENFSLTKAACLPKVGQMFTHTHTHTQTHTHTRVCNLYMSSEYGYSLLLRNVVYPFT
jgi:hypothetical protein